MKTCAHPHCTTTIADYQLACRDHWYELPTSLRNRIWKHYRRNPGGRAHIKAIREAHNHWNPQPVQLRCHSCRHYTDFTDDQTGQPICVVCATAGMTSHTALDSCSKCGNEASLLTSLTDRPPHICVDCMIDELEYVEAL